MLDASSAEASVTRGRVEEELKQLNEFCHCLSPVAGPEDPNLVLETD